MKQEKNKKTASERCQKLFLCLRNVLHSCGRKIIKGWLGEIIAGLILLIVYSVLPLTLAMMKGNILLFLGLFLILLGTGAWYAKQKRRMSM
ncbi:MAG: hypothetical protein PUD15_03565 [Prevotella sp.]|nr:hypothetical protein [Prevotella sp.]